MSNFPGGSAWAMARDIAGGYLSINERTLVRFRPPQLDQLNFELDRLLREVRGEQPAIDDMPAVQQRNRRMQRIQTAQMMMRAYRQKRRI